MLWAERKDSALRGAVQNIMAMENCVLCRGTGWKMVPRQDGAGLAAAACDCGVVERARIPKRYTDCDFESYVTDLTDGKNYTSQQTASLKQVKMVTQAFVRDY